MLMNNIEENSNQTVNVLEEQKKYSLLVKDIIEKRYDHQPYAYVHCYGCQQNVSDGEKLKGMLAEMGYGFTDNAETADFVIYNTCAVRENAEDRVFGNVGALKPIKKQKPQMLIALCGCMMQQQHIADKIKKSYPLVDIVFGTHVMHTLPQLIYKKLTVGKRVFDITETKDKVYEGMPKVRDVGCKAWVPIMNGCDNFCSYCIVPYVRGRERSRESAYIVEEVKHLVAQGYKEITLLGQNVNSYGKGLKEDTNFAKLLRMLNALDGEFRIRFMTPHPKDCTKELIDTIASCDKVCKHIHLPVQSGSDRILKLMNRKYNVEKYMELVNYAKEKIPNAAFTSDIIVGFPGETREDFLQTLNLIKEVRYTLLYTFIYSKRTGTPAAKMEDPTSSQDKSKWFREMLDVQDKIGLEINNSYVGTTQRILVDGIGKSGDGFISGRNDGNIIVELEGSRDLIGTFVDVKITKAMKWAILGELVQK